MPSAIFAAFIAAVVFMSASTISSFAILADVMPESFTCKASVLISMVEPSTPTARTLFEIARPLPANASATARPFASTVRPEAVAFSFTAISSAFAVMPLPAITFTVVPVFVRPVPHV